MEIEKNLVISTSHITQDDCVILEYETELITVVSDSWQMIYLPGLEEHSEVLEKYSPAFRELCSWAAGHEEGFTYIKFDCDGPVLDRFQTFEW